MLGVVSDLAPGSVKTDTGVVPAVDTGVVSHGGAQTDSPNIPFNKERATARAPARDWDRAGAAPSDDQSSDEPAALSEEELNAQAKLAVFTKKGLWRPDWGERPDATAAQPAIQQEMLLPIDGGREESPADSRRRLNEGRPQPDADERAA